MFFFWCPWSGLGDVPLAASPATSLGESTPNFWQLYHPGLAPEVAAEVPRSQGYHGGWLSPGGLSLTYRDAGAGQIQLGDHDLAELQAGVGAPGMGAGGPSPLQHQLAVPGVLTQSLLWLRVRVSPQCSPNRPICVTGRNGGYVPELFCFSVSLHETSFAGLA